MSNNALATVTDLPVRKPTGEAQHFELMQRKARMFAASPLIPEHLRKGSPEQAMANCYIALSMAESMQENPLIVLQNIHIVSGKAGFSAQYMIARANASGIFEGRIDWKIEGRGDTLAVTAFATLKDTGQEVSVQVTMAMAKAEGWTKNPKYQSMPEVMFRYRSATFLVRFYCPEVMLGYHTADEIEDVVAAAGPVHNLAATPLTGAALLEQAQPETVDAVATPIAAPATLSLDGASETLVLTVNEMRAIPTEDALDAWLKRNEASHAEMFDEEDRDLLERAVAERRKAWGA